MLNCIPEEFTRYLEKMGVGKTFAAFRAKSFTVDSLVRAFSGMSKAHLPLLLMMFLRREYRKKYPPELVERLRPFAEEALSDTFGMYERVIMAKDEFGIDAVAGSMSSVLASLDADDLPLVRENLAGEDLTLVEISMRAAAMANDVSDELRLECFRLASLPVNFVVFTLYDKDSGLRERTEQLRRLAVDPEVRSALEQYFAKAQVDENGHLFVPFPMRGLRLPTKNLCSGSFSALGALLELAKLDFLRDRIFELLSHDEVRVPHALPLWQEFPAEVEELLGRMGRPARRHLIGALPSYPEACTAILQGCEPGERDAVLKEYLHGRTSTPPEYDALILRSGEPILAQVYRIEEHRSLREGNGFAGMRESARTFARRFGISMRAIAEARIVRPEVAPFSAALLCELPAGEEDVVRLSQLPLGPAILVLSGRAGVLSEREPRELAGRLSDYAALPDDGFWVDAIDRAANLPALTETASCAFESFIEKRGSSLSTEHVAGRPALLALLAAASTAECADYLFQVLLAHPAAATVVGPLINRAPEKFAERFVHHLLAEGAGTGEGVFAVAARLPDTALPSIVEPLSAGLGASRFARVLLALLKAGGTSQLLYAYALKALRESEEIERRVELSKVVARNCREKTVQENLDAVAEIVEFGEERIAENILRMLGRLKIVDARIVNAASARLGRESRMKPGLKTLFANTVAGRSR